MRIVVYPGQLDFYSGKLSAQITVSKIIRFDPFEGFVRVSQSVWFIPATGMHRCRLNAGIYEIRADETEDFFVLLPQRIGLSIEVARELLENPSRMPKPLQIPQPFAKAMTALIDNGMSWAAATSLIGLGPNAEFPSHPFGDSKAGKESQY